MKRIILFATLFVLFLPGRASAAAPPAGMTKIPTFSITAVVKDSTVTITTSNFPASDTFTVTMGKMWTQGIGGVVVGSQNSGAGGTFSATYNIPDSLKGQYQISIRLQSPTSGYYAYNWFYNNTTGGGGNPPPPPPPSITIPLIFIQSVVRDSAVTITAQDFPKDDDFTVTMNYMGTKGAGGWVVGTQNSGNGAFSATYNIPDSLKGQYQIAIRLQSPTSGYYSYNWFYNNTTTP